MVHASPILLRNITLDPSPTSKSDVALYPTPFGSARPTTPTARTITIARIASPISVDRTYQPLFLHALHEYFENQPRLLKQGDIIALPIDTDNIHWLSPPRIQSDDGKDVDDTELESFQ